MEIKRYENILNQGIIISWTPEGRGSSRVKTISQKLSIPLKRFHLFTRKKLLFFIKFPFLILKTFLFLLKYRPLFVIADVTQPFILLPIYIYSRLKRIPFFSDLHSGPLVAPHLKPFKNILFFLLNKSELVILHETTITDFFKNTCIKTLILHDPLPYFNKRKIEDKKEKYLVYISVGSSDEPLEPVIRALEGKFNVKLYITGTWNNKNLHKIPENVKFTGFLKREKFEELLINSYGIMAFTEWEYTMLGAAYEALSLSKPLIVSNKKAIREFFKDAAIFVEHNSDSISKGIDKLLENHSLYLQKISRFKKEYLEIFEEEFKNFCKIFVSILKKYYKI